MKVDAASRSFLTERDALTFRFEDIPRALRRRFDEALVGLELTRTQWRLLAYVLRQEGLTQTELARLLELERATVGLAIDALTATGLVARNAVEGDRRVWTISPTPRARRLLPEMRETVDDVYAQIFRGFSAQDFRELKRLLDLVMKNIGE